MVMAYETYLIVNATQRLIELSQREGRIYKSEAFRRCGHGLTASQFDGVVKGLASDEEPWLTIIEGPNGGELLIYLDPWGDNLRQYGTR